MKIKVNFKAGEPTANGRIYPEEVLRKAFDKRFKTDVYISRKNSPYLKLDEIIAKAESYEITSKSEILIDVKILDTLSGEEFKNRYFEITTSGVGIFEDEQHIIISDQYKLSHFCIVKKKEK